MRMFRIVVKTTNGKVDKFENCEFVLEDRILCITEKDITYCYPLENLIGYEYKKR